LLPIIDILVSNVPLAAPRWRGSNEPLHQQDAVSPPPEDEFDEAAAFPKQHRLNLRPTLLHQQQAERPRWTAVIDHVSPAIQRGSDAVGAERQPFSDRLHK
jgi:hypothetical protein